MPIGGPAFARVLVEFAALVVAVGVAGVDLHDVVQQQHADHPAQVDAVPGGVLSEEHGRNGDVPGVLHGVFVAAAVEQEGLAKGVLQPVDLEQKFDLPVEPIVAPGEQPRVQSHAMSRVPDGHHPSSLRPQTAYSGSEHGY